MKRSEIVRFFPGTSIDSDTYPYGFTFIGDMQPGDSGWMENRYLRYENTDDVQHASISSKAIIREISRDYYGNISCFVERTDQGYNVIDYHRSSVENLPEKFNEVDDEETEVIDNLTIVCLRGRCTPFHAGRITNPAGPLG